MSTSPHTCNGLYPEPVFRVAGDRGLLMELSESIELETNQKIRALCIALEKSMPLGVLEVIPTYRSIVCIYDAGKTNPDKLQQELLAVYLALENAQPLKPDVVDLPVCYGGEFGIDLNRVADHNQLSAEEVIHLHSEPLYPVYMLGFTPGFPYLGGLSDRLHTPRLATPRSLVPAGSVGIANNQTGIYPIDSPGGWQLIGRCPYTLFDPHRENPFLIKAGDLLRFRPISTEEFEELARGNRS